MRFLTVVALAMLGFAVSAGAAAQSTMVNVGFVDNDGRQKTIDAVLTLPAKAALEKSPAIVILHHAGGWEAGTTSQYAEFLSSHGFLALEPRMFRNYASAPSGTYPLLPAVFGSLTYLAKRPEVDNKKIAVMGLSFGGVLSLYAGTEWANQKYQPGGEHRYAAIAPFYPVCWISKAIAGRTFAPIRNPASPYPESLMDKWAGIPMRIFAAGLDDYDSRDPKTCEDFVASIPDEKQKALSSVQLYPAATHGWDHGTTYSFHERIACKGKGCTNTNESNPGITQQAKGDLLKFLREKLGL